MDIINVDNYKIDCNIMYDKIKNYNLPFELKDDEKEAYLKFLILKVITRDENGDIISPTNIIDGIWHHHLLHNRNYNELCRLLNYEIYHYPNKENDNIDNKKERIQKMNQYYKEYFSDDVPELLKLKYSTKTEIFAKTLIGKTIRLDVYLDDTVLNLKEIVSKREGISICMLRLIYSGVQLDFNYKTLEECGLSENSTIHILLRLSGC